MIRRPPRSTLFPSTTLSRSLGLYPPLRGEHPVLTPEPDGEPRARAAAGVVHLDELGREPRAVPAEYLREGPPQGLRRRPRSEEHTSELQSRQYLVCRLLLEK